jgi:hypothetical protein
MIAKVLLLQTSSANKPLAMILNFLRSQMIYKLLIMLLLPWHI